MKTTYLKRLCAMLLALVMMLSAIAWSEGVEPHIEADGETLPEESGGTAVTEPLENPVAEADGFDLTDAAPVEPKAPVPMARDYDPQEYEISIRKNHKGTLNIGDTASIYVTAGEVAYWSSSNERVATVEFDGTCGYVEALEEGKAKLTARLTNGKKITVKLTVKNPYLPTAIAFMSDEWEVATGAVVAVGESLDLSEYVVFTPDWATARLTWKSAKSGTARVDGEGVLTGRKKGKTKITVTTSNKKKATLPVTVVGNELVNLCEKPTFTDIEEVDEGWTLWPLSVEMLSGGSIACEFYLLNGTGEKTKYIENLRLSLAVDEPDNIIAEHSFSKVKVSCKKNNSKIVKVTFPASSVEDSDVYFPDCEDIYFDFIDYVEPTLRAGKDNFEFIPTMFPSDDDRVLVSSILLNHYTYRLDIGATLQLTATVLPDDATDPTVVWSSSDPAVATVTHGIVKMIGQGSATITASAVDGSGVYATCLVTSGNTSTLVSSVELDKTIEYLNIGQTLTINATVLPANATNKALFWKSEKETVATVVDGVVTAVGIGTTKISATAADGGGAADYCIVSVSDGDTLPVTKVTLDQSSATLNIGQTLTLSATVLPENATNKALNWQSGDEAVATVADGVVTAVSRGTTLVTASATDGSGKADYCVVTVVDATPIPVAGITLDRTSATLGIGATLTLTAAVLPENATNKALIWSSSSASIATVSDGVVTGIAEGSALITAAAMDGSGVKASCTVKVERSTGTPVASVTLDRTSAELKVGETLSLTATVLPEDAAYKALNWTSSNEAVATVANGTVTAKADGTAVIQAAAMDGSGVKATCTVTVSKVSAILVTGITLNKTSAALKVDETLSLTATVLPEDAANKALNWTSSNEAVATVANGTVTAKAEGTAVIQAAAMDGSGVKATCTVTVSKVSAILVTGITLNKTSAALKVGETLTLAATVLPEDAANKTLNWSSSNDAVATVANGLVTAKADGTAVIQAAAMDGSGVKATCAVTVGNVPTVPVESIILKLGSETVSGKMLTVGVGRTLNLTATVLPENATNKALTWSSISESIATVRDGVVTGVSVGTTAIIVSLTDDSKVRTYCAIKVEESSDTPVSSVTLSKASETLRVGDTLTLTAAVLPENATNKALTWVSGNEAVATVAEGVVTAVSVGTAVITAAAADGGGAKGSCTVTVERAPDTPVASVTLSKTSETIHVGETLTLTAAVLPENAANKSLNWASGNEAVATVAEGVVTAVSEGTAVITAAAADGGAAKGTCTVTVERAPDIPVTGIALDKTSETLDVGDTLTLTATVTPESATNRALNWRTDDERVATVANGVVTAVGVGAATITAEAADGSDVRATCAVTVKQTIRPDYSQLSLGGEQHSASQVQAFLDAHPASPRQPVLYETAPTKVSPFTYGRIAMVNQYSALNRVNQYRYIAGLSADVALDESGFDSIQAKTYLNYLNGKMSHWPTKPSQLSEEEYQTLYALANTGWTGECLSSDRFLTESIDRYVSDSGNVQQNNIGHRTAVLMPACTKVSMGCASYSGMHITRTGGDSLKNIAWPARETPIGYFSTADLWSVFYYHRSIAEGSVSVRLTRQSDNRTWRFSVQSSDGFFTTNSSQILFKPDGLNRIAAGDTFQIVITDDVNQEQLVYSVHFFQPDDSSQSLLPAATVQASKGQQGVLLNWSSVDGATGYYVCRKNDDSFIVILRDVRDGLSFVDTTVASGETAKYCVLPHNDTLTSALPTQFTEFTF